MIQLGIFTGYFPYTMEEAAAKIRGHGFNTVQLDLDFHDFDPTLDNLTKANANRIARVFRSHDLPVCTVSGYCNMMHPDKDERESLLAGLRRRIELAREFGTPYVISETGTLNPDSDWSPHPDNSTEHAYEECRDIIGELAELARSNGAVFLLETYVSNIIGSIEQTERLFADIDSPGLGLLMDPTNYFDSGNINEIDGQLNAMHDRLAHHCHIGHAKDVKWTAETGELHDNLDASEAHNFRGVGNIELPAAGLGDLNYPLYFSRISESHPNIPMIIEHLDEADVPRAKAFLDGVLSEMVV